MAEESGDFFTDLLWGIGTTAAAYAVTDAVLGPDAAAVVAGGVGLAIYSGQFDPASTVDNWMNGGTPTPSLEPVQVSADTSPPPTVNPPASPSPPGATPQVPPVADAQEYVPTAQDRWMAENFGTTADARSRQMWGQVGAGAAQSYFQAQSAKDLAEENRNWEREKLDREERLYNERHNPELLRRSSPRGMLTMGLRDSAVGR